MSILKKFIPTMDADDSTQGEDMENEIDSITAAIRAELSDPQLRGKPSGDANGTNTLKRKYVEADPVIDPVIITDTPDFITDTPELTPNLSPDLTVEKSVKHLKNRTADDKASKSKNGKANGTSHNGQGAVTANTQPGSIRFASDPNIETQGISMTRAQQETPPKKIERVHLSDLRLDIARISSDIDNGDTLYKRAQSRIENLMEFIERAEVSLLALEKIEAESLEVKNRNYEVETQLSDTSDQLESLQLSYDRQQDELSLAKTELGHLSSQVKTLISDLERKSEECETLTSERQSLMMESEQKQTEMDIQLKENFKLQETLKEMSARMEIINSDKMSVNKSAQAVKTDNERLLTENTQKEKTISQLQARLSESNNINERMKDEFVEIQENLMNYRASQESLLVERNNRIAKLETLIGDLESRLRSKDKSLENMSAGVADLKQKLTAGEIEKQRLESLLERQNAQISASRNEASYETRSHAELDDKYTAIAASLSQDMPMTQPSAPTPAEEPIELEHEAMSSKDRESIFASLENLINKDYRRISAKS